MGGTQLSANASKHKALCRERMQAAEIEPSNGRIKHALGPWEFSMRDRDKARCGFQLVCAALNLRRMATMAVWPA